MNVIVASRNPVKVGAAEAAFRLSFPEAELAVTGIAAASGVSEQPVGDNETRQGALNRIRDARRQEPAADYYVGLEGGIETIEGELHAYAWMVIENDESRRGMARTPSLPLPRRVRELVDAGLELGDANDQVFSTHNSKQAGGAFGLLTGGRMTRESIYRDTLLLALVPFVHPAFD